jgi:TolB-like protein/Flp pilus assembly protein TadD
MPLLPGQRLAAYDIISTLGTGGMGEVYRARDSRLGRDVALKVLPPEVTTEPGRLERFDREARAIAALNHPNIVTIYSTEEADGIRFLTMEVVDGCTLGDLVLSSGMAVPRFLDIAIPLADALAAAHQKQITHRDLKPGNVMVSNDGRVKVLDFGLARIGGGEAGEQTLIATQAPITHQGMIVGTMPYMSPEQVEGRPIDARSDLFSLGVIFYELLAGERPFKGSSSPALMSAILRDSPPAITDKRNDVPEAVERLLSRLIEKRPEDRIQTARDVYNELRHIKGERSTGVQRSSATRSPVENLSVAVLPFTVRGVDADAEAMAAGLTEDITTSLARFAGLSVVAAQSTRAFKDSPLDVRQIAERIGARYMISGNVRKSGAAIRVSAQLIDAPSGTQMWSETYDRRLDNATDVFAIQDDVTDHIVATIADENGVLAYSMVRSVQQTAIGDSSDHQLILQLWGFQQEPAPQRHAELRAAFETLVEAKHDNAEAWASLANLYIAEHQLWFNPLPDPLGRAVRAARRAVEIDRANQKGWQWLGVAHYHLHDRRGLEESLERALRINPRNSNTMAWMGSVLTNIGEYERGRALMDRAMQINPGHPGWFHFTSFTRHVAAGEFEEALQAARRVNIPNFFWMHFAIAAAAGQLGRSADGAAAYDAMVRLLPPLGEAANLREFVARWFWDEAVIETLVEGVERSFSDRSTDRSTDVLRSANVRKPPSSTSGSRRSTDPSIAVLPFADLSEKKDQDWFCDGIAEEILNALASLPGLRVAARASAFSLRGKADDLTSIGEKLNVTTVLEGSVRRAGDRVRITVQLSDAQQGRQIWSERFDRELKDIFDVQEEIARAIAERLRITISGGATRLVPQATTNMEAYELLLKGRAFVTRRGRAVLDAIPLFERAILLDPNLAEAHALLGDAYRLLGLYGIVRASEVMPKARACVERALALDPNQAEALATHAIIASVYEWDFDEVIRRSDRALAADPNHVRQLAERAISIACFFSLDDSWHQPVMDLLARARALDPLNAWVLAVEAFAEMLAGRQEAIPQAQRAIGLDANNFTAHWIYSAALAEFGRDDESLAASVPALAMSGRSTMILTTMAAIYCDRGQLDQVEAIRAELNERATTGFIGTAALACVAASAGRWPEARDLIARAVAERDPFVAFWKMRAWRPLWRDEQCAAMLRATSLFKSHANA